MTSLREITVPVAVDVSVGHTAAGALSEERAARAAADVAVANYAIAADRVVADRVAQLETRLAETRVTAITALIVGLMVGVLLAGLGFKWDALEHRVDEHLRMFLTPSGGSILVNPLPPTAPVTPEPDEQPGDVLRQGGPTQSVRQVAIEVSRG